VRRFLNRHCRGWRQFRRRSVAGLKVIVLSSVCSPTTLYLAPLSSRRIRPQPRQYRLRNRRTKLLRHHRGVIVVRRFLNRHCRGWRQFRRRSVAGVKVIVLCSVCSPTTLYLAPLSTHRNRRGPDNTDSEIDAQRYCGTIGV
jgi:hypothetical protein